MFCVVLFGSGSILPCEAKQEGGRSLTVEHQTGDSDSSVGIHCLWERGQYLHPGSDHCPMRLFKSAAATPDPLYGWQNTLCTSAYASSLWSNKKQTLGLFFSGRNSRFSKLKWFLEAIGLERHGFYSLVSFTPHLKGSWCLQFQKELKCLFSALHIQAPPPTQPRLSLLSQWKLR